VFRKLVDNLNLFHELQGSVFLASDAGAGLRRPRECGHPGAGGALPHAALALMELLGGQDDYCIVALRLAER